MVDGKLKTRSGKSMNICHAVWHWVMKNPRLSSIHLILTDSSSLWPIRGQYPWHVNSLNQSEACVQVTWPVVTNHNLSSAEWNSILKILKDVKLVTSSKSELESIWYLLNSAHQDSGRACVQHPTPIVVTQKGQRSLTHFIPAWACFIDQSGASIKITWTVLTNQRPVFWSRD